MRRKLASSAAIEVLRFSIKSLETSRGFLSVNAMVLPFRSCCPVGAQRQPSFSPIESLTAPEAISAPLRERVQ